MMHTNMICKVERYDNTTGIGDLEPLFLDDAGNGLPLIVNARAIRHRLKLPKRLILESGSVNHSHIPNNGTSHTINSGENIVEYEEEGVTQDVVIYPDYKKGDIVMACIMEREFSDAIKGRKGNGDSKEPFGLYSAVIVGLAGD